MYAAILQRKEFTVRFEKFRIMINDVPCGVRKETFRPRRREFVSLRDTIYIYIFSLHLSSSKQPADRGTGISTENGREGKESRGVVTGSGERRFRREGGETLNRCNSFSWTSAKSYIVSGPSILITFSSPFELYMSVFFSSLSPHPQFFCCL